LFFEFAAASADIARKPCAVLAVDRFFLYDRSVTGVTDVSPSHLYIRHSVSIWRQEEDMAPKPDRLVFVFGMVVAMAVTILAITTWAAPPKPESDSAAPISPRQTIYRPQRWNLY